MSVVKTYRFPVDIDWQGGQRFLVSADDKPELAVAAPPEFRGVGGV